MCFWIGVISEWRHFVHHPFENHSWHYIWWRAHHDLFMTWNLKSRTWTWLGTWVQRLLTYLSMYVIYFHRGLFQTIYNNYQPQQCVADIAFSFSGVCIIMAKCDTPTVAGTTTELLSIFGSCLYFYLFLLMNLTQFDLLNLARIV